MNQDYKKPYRFRSLIDCTSTGHLYKQDILGPSFLPEKINNKPDQVLLFQFSRNF